MNKHFTQQGMPDSLESIASKQSELIHIRQQLEELYKDLADVNSHISSKLTTIYTYTEPEPSIDDIAAPKPIGDPDLITQINDLIKNLRGIYNGLEFSRRHLSRII